LRVPELSTEPNWEKFGVRRHWNGEKCSGFVLLPFLILIVAPVPLKIQLLLNYTVENCVDIYLGFASVFWLHLGPISGVRLNWTPKDSIKARMYNTQRFAIWSRSRDHRRRTKDSINQELRRRR
jgi:hypothetical protein